MKKKQLLLSAMLALMGTGVANAQKAYVYVQQNGTKIDALGTAAYDLSGSSTKTLEFDENGKAVVKIGENTVAALPLSNNGQLVIEFETSVTDENLNKVSKTVGSAGYATIYSPFQLVPGESTVEVYAPSYDLSTHTLKCNDAALVAAGEIIPVGTGLLLKKAGDITFSFSAAASTATQTSALTGSALAIDKSAVEVGSEDCLYTLGHDKTDSSLFGFFKYTGSNALKAGYAFLVAPKTESNTREFVALDFSEDETTSIVGLNGLSSSNGLNGKFLKNGRIVIIKNGVKYNVNGQEVK